jgi:hypothetical protein
VRRSWGRAAVLGVVLSAAFGFMQLPAAADGGDRGAADSDGDTLTGDAVDQDPGRLVPGESADGGSGGSGGPNCTKSDGTRDYLRYEGLQHTTMHEQRTEIRPEEQRPGVYLHIYCGDEYLDFQFFADAPDPVVVDPRTLADRVQITPPDPAIRTNPAAGDHLVGVEAWFWVDDPWRPISRDATAGVVTVTVTAEPTELIIDPGDGSPTFSCVRPPAFDESLPANAQSSDCTHTYERAANVTVTATMVYETSFTSNLPGAGGALDPIEVSASADLAVAEAQAVNTGG